MRVLVTVIGSVGNDGGKCRCSTSPNAVALGVRWWDGPSDGNGFGGWRGRLGPVAVSAFLDAEVGQLAFDDAGLAAQAPGG
jgi:hypothetical protein